MNSKISNQLRKLMPFLRAKPDAHGKYHADAIRNILVCRPNHRLGNLLLITPLLQEIKQAFPRANVDLFVKGEVAPLIFTHYGVRRIIKLPSKPARNSAAYLGGWLRIRFTRYDLVINAVNESSSGKISTRFANGAHHFLGYVDDDIRARFPDHPHISKYPVYSFRQYIRQFGIFTPDKPVPPLDLRLTPAEVAAGADIVLSLVKNRRPVICLYTYATGRKLYGPDWWRDFYDRLKERYRDYNVIEMLPIQNVSQLGFAAPSIYSRNIREMGAIIANTALFIGADSGVMHLASAAGAPVVGLFKSPNMKTYAPYNGGSTGINTDDSGIEGCLRAIDAILDPVIRSSGRPPDYPLSRERSAS